MNERLRDLDILVWNLPDGRTFSGLDFLTGFYRIVWVLPQRQIFCPKAVIQALLCFNLKGDISGRDVSRLA